MGLRNALRTLVNRFQQDYPAGPRGSGEEVVYAVAKCHPVRVALYTAAFQGGWKIEFKNSLQETLEAARFRKPKAVFYDHAMGDPTWDHYGSQFRLQDIRFVLLAHKASDEVFMIVLSVGGYYASGDPLTSEDIVKAVDFAEEVAGLSHVVVG